MDFPGRLIAGFLAIVLLFIFPLQYITGLSDEDIDSLVDHKTHQLCDSVREKGHLDRQMYEDYISFLDTTGEKYEIEIQDIKPVKGDNYTIGSSIKTNREASFKRLSYNEVKSFTAHTHTDDCYDGYLHVCDGTDCEYENEAEKILIGAGQRDSKIYMYYSYDGVTWYGLPNNSGSGYDVKSLTYMNGQFIWRKTAGSINTSKDGINWTSLPSNIAVTGLPSDIELNNRINSIVDIAHAGNGLYYGTANGNKLTGYSNPKYISKGLLLKSTDLINWQYCSYYDRPLDKLGISLVGTQKILVALSPGSSTDGRYPGYYTWDINSDGTLDNNSFTMDTSNTYMSLQINQAGDYAIITNTDNSGFTIPKIYYSSYNFGYNSLFKYGNGIYLAVSRNINNNIRLLYKGNSLTNMSQVADHNIANLNALTGSMVFFDDRFIVSCSEQSGSYVYYTYTSKDGISWTRNNAPVNFTSLVCNTEGGSGKINRGPCLKEGKYYDNAGNEVFPICDRVVTSITATNPIQTVNKGGTIITTATATYLDGHTGIVNCTSNFNPDLIGTQKVTLTYIGLVGNAKTSGTRICTISVTVTPDKKLNSITVLPKYQCIQRYSSPTFTVTANYDDGKNRILNTSEYIISDLNPSNIGLQSIIVSYTEGGITRTSTVSVNVTALMKKCPRCRQLYELNSDDTDPGCPYCRELITGIEVNPSYVEVTQGNSLPVTVTAIYNDGSREEVTGWASNYVPDKLGIQTVTIQYRGYAADITVWVNEKLIRCPVCDTEYPASKGSCPVCTEKVVRISASPKEVTVNQYEAISLDVTAYYADGSSRIVDDWAIDRTTASPGTFIATVIYKGVTDTVKITVLSLNSIICPICGTIYDLSENAKGCPVCANELIGIEAYLTSGSNQVQYGSLPAIAVILIFRDEHREFASDGYELEDFDSHKPGVQTVRVLYKGFSTTIIIEVVNILDGIICPNGHLYYKNSDGTDPGCPFCHGDDEASRIVYFDITYTTEILNTVYSSGIYHFEEGNYISVIVTKKDKSLMYRLQKTFFGTSILGRKKRFIYGGEVSSHE